MNKKILLVSVIILVLTVLFAACKKNEQEPANKNTDKAVQTVTVTDKDGGIINVEIFEDASGDRYITNVEGEKLPLTTDDQGFADDIGYIVTSKVAETSPSTAAPATDSSAPSESASSGGIIIGTPDETKQDVITYDEIVNAKK